MRLVRRLTARGVCGVQADRPFECACLPGGPLYQCGARGSLVAPAHEVEPRIIGELASASTSASADEQAAVTFTAYFMLGVGQVGCDDHPECCSGALLVASQA